MLYRFYSNFEDYLKSQDIKIVQGFDKDNYTNIEDITEKAVIEQLEAISLFHEKTMGSSSFVGKKLNNSTGKKVEEYKVYLKKLKRDLKRIEEEGPINSFESLILVQGDECLQRAEKCVKRIYEAGYYDLISRSMKRGEVCLGNTYHTNLRKKETIEVVNLRHCAYNMVECDAVYYLSKLKRNDIKLDWSKLINIYCQKEGLDQRSMDFIAAMSSFPYEVLKCCNRYRYRKKDWTEEEYKNRLLRAFEKDGSIIE